MSSHMKLPLPSRNPPRSDRQSPCEANGGMGLSPMSAYFEGPQGFFGGNPGPAAHEPVVPPRLPSEPQTSVADPPLQIHLDSQLPAPNTVGAQQAAMPFVFPTQMPWPAGCIPSGPSGPSASPTPGPSGPTLLQSVPKAAPKIAKPQVETKASNRSSTTPAAVFVDLSSLRKKM